MQKLLLYSGFSFQERLNYNYSILLNYQKAIELYKKACDGGDTLACSNLGFMYKQGNGVLKIIKKQKNVIKKHVKVV